LTLLPEDGLSQAQHVVFEERHRDSIAALYVWIQRKAELGAHIEIEIAVTVRRLAVTQTDEHRVILLPAELPRQRVEVVAHFGHVFHGIDPDDKYIEAIAELRQFHSQPESQGWIES